MRVYGLLHSNLFDITKENNIAVNRYDIAGLTLESKDGNQFLLIFGHRQCGYKST